MLDKPAVATLLSQRFLGDKHTSLSQLPLPHTMSGAKKAASIIAASIKNNEKIAIVGDYDCDGVCSSAILDEFFCDIGYENYKVKIPNRFKDGYGLNESIVSELDVQLIITVDNGITAFEAANECKKRGIKLVITDHHMPLDELPRADALVDPQCKDNEFAFKEICGAQVAWYLVAALKDELGLVGYELGKFTDLLALAIIADMMELKDMNRVLVRAGLRQINSFARPCFSAIARLSGKESFAFDDISFLITPLIKSAGRMDDATVSFEFLRSRDLRCAEGLLAKISECNAVRKEREKELFELCAKSVSENDKVVVVWGEGWHEGVIGIVASRLARMYKRPAIVFSIDGQRAKGSARSVGKFDILALISSCESFVSSFGGHKGAAGLVAEPSKLVQLKTALNQACTNVDFNQISHDDLLGDIKADCVDNELMDIIDSFAPYGSKNPKPVFALRCALVVSVNTLGSEGLHLRLVLRADNRCFEAVYFNFEKRPAIGVRIDVLFILGRNYFRGQESLQLIIQEIL
ncbi:single-stranded-DNA-specific exonuclease RecJ [Campylobacter sp.]|uniref:single-stranded-DNA-specific exonuclease RecJ n=1 Tax=Campylobacter sp. TaxID=205 RepID=UPI002AA61515|nr:single-stranded-DNA-specific exonuclease RecJ [Campylobacter sp.]MCI7237465.1 single-stranded-DNA-specific exonuclease RecJ [Campylobacter sp.]